MIKIDILKNHPEWDKKIEAGLLKECEALTGIRDDFKTHALYAERDSTFAGGIHFEIHGDILWIDSLWIEPDFRKQGVGKQLIEDAAQIKAKEIQLNTFFSEAHAFFLKCGFEDVALIPNWKYGLDCYLMRKKL
jgi:N-acetylglutamate synthase-like GNAT family acetyltransferase